jgi:protein-tyrosine phosphatase
LIDLHCHMLPGVDDGAGDLETALAMARLATADGITVTACTPHILPGVYDNGPETIGDGIGRLACAFTQHDIPLRLVPGADIHVSRDLVEGLRSGRLPTLNGSRYFLLEPPHHVAPPQFEDYVFSILTAGYVPVVTHPERFAWIDSHYSLLQRIAERGTWMQITAGSVLGEFGSRAQYWAERMLDEGLVHLMASDGHGAQRRRPVMRRARDRVARRLGEDEAQQLVAGRPGAILQDLPPADAAPPAGSIPLEREPPRIGELWRRVFARGT